MDTQSASMRDLARRLLAANQGASGSQVDEAVAADPSLGRRYPACPAAGGGRADSLITFVTDRPGHDRRYAINPAKIESELGFIPQETFETGLKRTIEWFLANASWWRAVMDGSYRDWIETQYQGAQPLR